MHALKDRVDRDVPHDGNCLFHAVSGEVLRAEKRFVSSTELREGAAEMSACYTDAMRAFPGVWQRDNIPATPEEYAEFISKDGVWGTTFDIHLLSAFLLFRPIYVRTATGSRVVCYKIHPIHAREGGTVHETFRVEYLTGDELVDDDDLCIGSNTDTHFWQLVPPHSAAPL